MKKGRKGTAAGWRWGCDEGEVKVEVEVEGEVVGEVWRAHAAMLRLGRGSIDEELISHARGAVTAAGGTHRPRAVCTRADAGRPPLPTAPDA